MIDLVAQAWTSVLVYLWRNSIEPLMILYFSGQLFSVEVLYHIPPSNMDKFCWKLKSQHWLVSTERDGKCLEHPLGVNVVSENDFCVSVTAVRSRTLLSQSTWRICPFSMLPPFTSLRCQALSFIGVMWFDSSFGNI